jgi:hypothetical protein
MMDAGDVVGGVMIQRILDGMLATDDRDLRFGGLEICL